MGRGLGEQQRKILEILEKKDGRSFTQSFRDESEIPDFDGEDIDLNLTPWGSVKVEFKGGWFSVGTIMMLLVNGMDCFTNMKMEDQITVSDMSESERQSIWRSIRGLEDRGLIISVKDTGDQRLHYKSAGGAMYNKMIKLKEKEG